jgi:hypothetical protein
MGFGQSEFWKNIKVRKAFETKTEDDDKAANLSFSFPKEKSNYFVINAGLGYEFGSSSKESKNKKIFKNSFSGFFVYNRNNQIDKEQNNYKLGVSSNQIFYTNTETSTAIFGANTIEYLRNYYDSSHSVLFTSYWHPFIKKANCIKLGGYTQADHLLAYYFLPQLGLEYQNKFEAKQYESKGYDLRGYFGLGSNLLLKKKTYDDNGHLLSKNRWTKGVELIIRYEARISVFNNFTNNDAYIPMFKTELNLYPTQDNKFSIGVSYNNGANPVDGLEKQNFWLLALKFKK